MSIFSSYKKIFLLGFIIVILIAIPFSVYIAQQRQQTESKAAQSTTLSFDPASTGLSPVPAKVGESLTLNVVLDPGTGITANQISFVKLSITFDPAKFTAETFKPSTDPKNTLIVVLEEASLTSGRASISLSIGADPTRALTSKSKIAELKLQPLAVTDASNPKTSIAFDTPNTQVLSIASSDQTSENVLSTTSPVEVSIAQAATTTPLPAPFGSPTATSTLTPTPRQGSVGFPASQTGSEIGGTGLSTGSAVFNPAPVFEIESTPTVIVQEPLPPTGPGENILGIGIVGIIFTIIGGTLLILL